MDPQHYTLAQRALAGASLAASVVYLIWRLLWTSSGSFLPFFLLLLAVDLIVVGRHVLNMLPYVSTSKGRDLRIPREPAASDLVFLLSDEPLIQVRVALRAALEIRGVATLSVIDGSGRPEVAKMCKRFGVRYVPSDQMSTAISSDMLVARRRSPFTVVVPGALWLSPDLVVIAGQAFQSVDTAMVSFPVQMTSDVGLVGSDGYRTTADSDPIWAKGADVAGSALPLDGPVVIRRSALRSCGGFTAASERFVLETAMRLAAAKWQLRFIDRPMALRPADWDEDRALRNRARLVGGRLDIVRDGRFGFWSSELPRWARISHLMAGLELLASPARMVAFALVPLTALTGRLPLTTSIPAAFVFGGGWFALRGLARRRLLSIDDAVASDLRRGSRVLGTDLFTLGGRGNEWRAGSAASAQAWTTMGLLVAAAVGAFAQTLGWALRPLPGLAHASLLVAAAGMVWLARDSSWAVTDRQHRLLPRVSFSGRLLGDVVQASPYGLDVLGGLPVGAEFVVPVTLPLPGNRVWTTQVNAVVLRHSEIGGQETSYLRFDLTERLFDELAYYCAVTAPTLRWLGRSDLRAFGQPVANGRRRTPSALMSKRHATSGGKTVPLPRPPMVVESQI